MDTCNDIIQKVQEKLKQDLENFDNDPEVEVVEKKKPKKSEKQIFYMTKTKTD